MFTAPATRSVELLPDSIVRSNELMLSAADFFGELSKSRRGPCTYFTAPVADIDGGGLLERASGWEALATGAAEDDVRACRPWLQLWAASAGACTQAHYDVADNVFIQLHGRKEFLVWPPQYHEALHLFPDSHPRSRKSMLRIEEPDLARHPLAVALPPPLRLVLEPGDAITLPAFWIHHVTALTECVSINVFSESPIKLAAAEAFELSVPLHPSWPMELRREGLATVVHTLLGRLGLRTEPVLTRLLDSRFAPLAPLAPPLSDAPAGAAPPRRARKRPLPAPPLDEHFRSGMRAHADDTAGAFDRLHAACLRAAPAYQARWQDESTPCLSASEAPDPAAHYAAIRDITLFHVFEMWALKLFGPDALEAELRRLRDSTPR